MDIMHYLKHDDVVLLLTFSILVVMSILTWYIIILRSVKLFAAKKANKQFLKDFWNSPNLTEAMEKIESHKGPMADMTRQSKKAMDRYNDKSYSNLHNEVPINEYLTRHIRNAMFKSVRNFDNGLTALASIGATAPFVGLFGTVWGIYHALINISKAGQVTLAVVSAPIGEALVATAFGLFVAIPAVLAYNALSRSNKNMNRDIDNFAHDLHVQLLKKGN